MKTARGITLYKPSQKTVTNRVTLARPTFQSKSSFTTKIFNATKAPQRPLTTSAMTMLRSYDLNPNLKFTRRYTTDATTATLESTPPTVEATKQESEDVKTNRYNRKLRSYVAEGIVSRAEAIFKEMKNNNIPRTEVTYVLMAKLYKNQKHVDKIVQMMEDMKKNEIEVPNGVYNALFQTLAMLRRVKDLHSWYDYLQANNVDIDHVLFRTIVVSFRKVGEMSTAEDINAIMKQKLGVNVPTDEHLEQLRKYYKTLKELIVARDYRRAEDLYQQLKQSDIIPSRSIVFLMLLGYARQKKPFKLRKLLDEMKTFSMKLDFNMTTVAATGFASVGAKDDVLQLLERARAENVKLSVKDYTRILLTTVRAPCPVDDCIVYFEDAKLSNVVPDRIMFRALLMCLARRGAIEQMMEYFDKMREQGFEPDESIFDIMIDGFGRRGSTDIMLDWFNRMKEWGYQPTAPTYNSIISAYGRNAQFDEMLKWYETMQQTGIEPNQYTFNVMIDSFAKEGQLDKMEEWFDNMRAVGIQPNKPILKNLLVTYIDNHLEDKIAHTLKIAKQAGVQLFANQ